MAEELTELEARLFEWIRQSDFETVAWSTAKAARSFKVKQDEVYEAVSALTRKVPDRIQVFYKNGAVHIAAVKHLNAVWDLSSQCRNGFVHFILLDLE